MNQTGSGNPPGDNILYNGIASRGNPNLFVTQWSIEPYPGWSFGVNRLVEYGGGSGLPNSASFWHRGFLSHPAISKRRPISRPPM